MSVNIKVKHLVLFAFIFGCATGPAIQKYLSFQDAVAKTGKKCHYAQTNNFFLAGLTLDDDGKKTKLVHALSTHQDGDLYIKDGWKPTSIGGSGKYTMILWEKCAR